MGDCHSSDPGSNPGPGALELTYFLGLISRSFANISNIFLSDTAKNDIVFFTPNCESNSEPSVEYSFPPDSFTIKYAAAISVVRILALRSRYASIYPLAK